MSSPPRKTSPSEAEWTELSAMRSAERRLSHLVCILASALILSTLISATFVVLFMTGIATRGSGREREASRAPLPFFVPINQGMNATNAAAQLIPTDYDYDYPLPAGALPPNLDPAMSGQRRNRARTASTQEDLRYNKLAALSNQETLNEILRTITIPRPVNSRNHAMVQNLITSSMEAADWTVTKDTFSQWIPYRGTKTFTNIIATLNPLAPYKLVLACHYDSKLTNFPFAAATDSAGPCAVLLNIAKYMTPLMLLEPSKMTNTTVQMIFFDGEEAFNRWSATDSLYGSRHLAQLWSTQNSLLVPGKKEIDTIELFVLLDLLGQSERMGILNYFQNTASRYRELQNIEVELSNRRLLVERCNGKNKFFKANRVQNMNIEDDHLPFLRRGVKIVHLIPYPFPTVWHTRNDNLDAIDVDELDNFNRILNVFIADFFKLTTLPEPGNNK